jgi:hypothetical protein
LDIGTAQLSETPGDKIAQRLFAPEMEGIKRGSTASARNPGIFSKPLSDNDSAGYAYQRLTAL